MPAHPGTRSDATKSRLLDAAQSAFASHGYHGTTTRDIASAAGMSPAALYVHHASKEELLFLISRSGHEQVLALLQEAVAASDDAVAQLRAVMRGFTLFHIAAHDSARIVNYELEALSPAHRAEVEGLRRQIFAVFEDLVLRGRADGLFTVQHPRITAVALQSLGVDVARWFRAGGWSPQEIADAYVEMALRIVGAGQ